MSIGTPRDDEEEVGMSIAFPLGFFFVLVLSLGLCAGAGVGVRSGALAGSGILIGSGGGGVMSYGVMVTASLNAGIDSCCVGGGGGASCWCVSFSEDCCCCCSAVLVEGWSLAAGLGGGRRVGRALFTLGANRVLFLSGPPLPFNPFFFFLTQTY